MCSPVILRYTRQDSNLRSTGSKCRNLKIQKCCYYKHLILFNFLNRFLVSFGEVLKYVPHRQWVFSISKRLRIYFRFDRKAFRKNQARLIHKIYNVHPLVCTKCWGYMRIISFIEDDQLVKKILKQLDLWDVKRKLPPRANPPEADPNLPKS